MTTTFDLARTLLLVWALLTFLALSFYLWWDAFIKPIVGWIKKRNTERSQLPGVRSGKCVTEKSSAQTDAAIR